MAFARSLMHDGPNFLGEFVRLSWIPLLLIEIDESTGRWQVYRINGDGALQMCDCAIDVSGLLVSGGDVSLCDSRVWP
jgi:steroid 5-alpha reductase family enzyme